MNVLILTPDAVGSTLLQRLITIYMNFHKYNKPVINLHELTNGIEKYYNDRLKQHVLGKPKTGTWGYYQNLQQIVELLDNADHYKTSRLAHYHIKNRQDSISDQIPFYQYLNDNFYIISCRRHNVFEHALSWGLTKITKKLNVYNEYEKINSFFELYRDGIYLDPNSLIQTLNAYRDYTEWCNNHFNVVNYFYYDEHLPRIEQFILNLPMFKQHEHQITWKDKFGINFNQWNLCHYISSDLGSIALNQPEKFKQIANHTTIKQITADESTFLNGYQLIADKSWPSISSIADYYNLPEHIRSEVEQLHKLIPTSGGDPQTQTILPQPLIELLTDSHRKFLNQYRSEYQESLANLNDMVNDGLIVSSPPIKKQILAEKKHMILNYQQLLDVYNHWVELNPTIGNPVTSEVLENFSSLERNRWDPTSLESALAVEQSIR